MDRPYAFPLTVLTSLAAHGLVLFFLWIGQPFEDARVIPTRHGKWSPSLRPIEVSFVADPLTPPAPEAHVKPSLTPVETESKATPFPTQPTPDARAKPEAVPFETALKTGPVPEVAFFHHHPILVSR